MSANEPVNLRDINQQVFKQGMVKAADGTLASAAHVLRVMQAAAYLVRENPDVLRELCSAGAETVISEDAVEAAKPFDILTGANKVGPITSKVLGDIVRTTLVNAASDLYIQAAHYENQFHDSVTSKGAELTWRDDFKPIVSSKPGLIV
ncbi:MAG: hypothetical protein HRT94_04400 [Alphaproteobacteria bacterium]|nr:hypothetical protein [Alphaproteobacteria bacterium]